MALHVVTKVRSFTLPLLVKSVSPLFTALPLSTPPTVCVGIVCLQVYCGIRCHSRSFRRGNRSLKREVEQKDLVVGNGGVTQMSSPRGSFDEASTHLYLTALPYPFKVRCTLSCWVPWVTQASVSVFGLRRPVVGVSIPSHPYCLQKGTGWGNNPSPAGNSFGMEYIG